MISAIQFMYLVSIIIFIFFNKKFGIKLLLMSISINMFMFPSVSIASAKQGYDLWITVIVASLFPFFILNDLMISLGIPDTISNIFSKPFGRIFKTSGYGAYVFILSIFSGYPTAAKIISQLINENKITNEEGQRILNFSSTSGPLFVVGSVGAGMLKNEFAGYIILISHILGALLNGYINSFFYKRKVTDNFSVANKNEENKNKNIFYNAIVNSLFTTGLIGGYIIFFSVVIGLLNHINFFTILNKMFNKTFPGIFSSILVLLIQSLLEISNGCNIIANSNLTFETILILETFIISFSGLSILLQFNSILHGCNINFKKYIFSKISHSLLSSFICFVLLKIGFVRSMVVFKTNSEQVINPFIIIQVMLTLILLAIISSKFLTNRKGLNF